MDTSGSPSSTVDREKAEEIVQHLTRSARVLRVLSGYVAVYDDKAVVVAGGASVARSVPLRLVGLGRTMKVDVRWEILFFVEIMYVDCRYNISSCQIACDFQKIVVIVSWELFQ